jgi:hypothetical protein
MSDVCEHCKYLALLRRCSELGFEYQTAREVNFRLHIHDGLAKTLSLMRVGIDVAGMLTNYFSTNVAHCHTQAAVPTIVIAHTEPPVLQQASLASCA